ncbi:DUF3577 domain-containing protein [Achromobacter sp. LC458]|uniref:DUF3577 domain-containing protein n=2 Tax=Achromobacter piechaudii TaxID=72556 RepID=A0ABM8KT62_9BURK|nr:MULTISPECIES: DUF3577 domain-containing protein [Achromobacter]EFF78366.1 hypothetical protein HMPREF0004_0278 [Achromobacter piechaudii ATCC 43553]TRM54119.1 DUF3577 domain-containing protein [Achromobacter sp. LC458]GLK94747.1 hypothetical protein GCM10008164_24850 [Achromobacter xylosoxidans]CAB3671028.1 hypothetical protein LMG1873_01116 [Achromobacter piechaudii]
MAQANTPKYFDAHLRGLGYVRRVREVKPKKGAPFLSCSISIFHGEAQEGSADSLTWLNCDVKIVGKEAIKVMSEKLQEAANDSNRKVLASVTIGDPYIDTYKITSGTRAGQTGVVLKGRLLKIHMAKVDGVMVYQYVEPEASAEGVRTGTDDN